MSSEPITLGPVSKFPKGEGVRVELDEFPVPIAVFNGEEGFYAVTDSCPHKGAPLSRAGTTPKSTNGQVGGTRGKLDEEEGKVSCPWHGMEFDLDSGNCPSTNYRIGSFDVSVEDGEVVLRR